MKRLLNAYKSFKMILKADSYCLITTNRNAYSCEGDITAKNFKVVIDDVLDNFKGQEDALNQVKEIVKNIDL